MTGPLMTGERLDALARAGLVWHPTGEAALRGPLLRLADDCDRAFVRLASGWEAQEERHPATLPAELLQRVDYLRSFPHQATFAVAMDGDEANLEAFLSGPVLTGSGAVAPAALAPVRDVLTPAACYHLYRAHEGESLDRPLHLTTRNTCFRREHEYVPLRRLRSFSMREVVCLGTRAETAAFLAALRERVERFCELVGLPVEWANATDPFFRPQRNPKALLQRIAPVKHEAVYGDLAIGSTNDHHDRFGEGFGIDRDGAPAHSACVAFGIERWLFALTDRHGTDPAGWPALPDAAAEAADAAGGRP
ncbi:aminoacyl--tRNA ligase-related protein [Thermomonospora cellulosilytica]|uniref:Seryl-tRNA synthetase n=1 Tax=Thermomonospora cellulosilytica TaxID=1411118 RepID=A0A7W3RBD8_9ACTN|nr:aminoacyl--tRNA ligase-related protein [Thermomonospora cellulosilytica]MBA9006781.1 seryl-tRNA synthetase [Thermomonospora cellulosilytica]